MFSKIVLDAKPDAFEQKIEEYKREDRRGDRRRYSRRCAQADDGGLQADRPRRLGQAVPRRSRTSSCGWPSRPSSPPGTTSAPSTTAISTRLPTIWAPPSMCRRWSSATWATTAPPASPSPATPATGEKKLYGDYLINAQGEDVVAGIRNTSSIDKLADEMPEVYAAVPGDCAAPGAALSRRAGSGVHHRARATSTCSRRARPSARPPRRSRSRWTWSARG